MRFFVTIVPPGKVFGSARRWAAISGLTCLAMLIVGGSLQLGNVTIPPVATAPRQIAVGAVGIVLLLVAVFRVESANHVVKAGPLADPDFWAKVFDCMPPAFIKEYPDNSNIADNQPFRTYQGAQAREHDDTDEFHSLIGSDHRQGDRMAASHGASVFLEFSDHFPTRRPQLILTFKNRVEHKGGTYIAGWYVPIDSPPPDAATATVVELRKRGEQVLFPMPGEAATEDNGFVISIGKAVRRPDLYARPAGEPPPARPPSAT